MVGSEIGIDAQASTIEYYANYARSSRSLYQQWIIQEKSTVKPSSKSMKVQEPIALNQRTQVDNCFLNASLARNAQK